MATIGGVDQSSFAGRLQVTRHIVKPLDVGKANDAARVRRLADGITAERIESVAASHVLTHRRVRHADGDHQR